MCPTALPDCGTWSATVWVHGRDDIFAISFVRRLFLLLHLKKETKISKNSRRMMMSANSIRFLVRRELGIGFFHTCHLHPNFRTRHPLSSIHIVLKQPTNKWLPGRSGVFLFHVAIYETLTRLEGRIGVNQGTNKRFVYKVRVRWSTCLSAASIG